MAVGRKTVAPRTPIASQWGNWVWDQSVQTFADRTQRAAQFPAPQVGAVTVLDDWPGIPHVWNGTAWMATQYGATVATTDALGALYLFYPKPFAGTPVAAQIHAPADSNIMLWADPITGQTAATNIGIIVRNWNRTTGLIGAWVNSQVGFSWSVTGPS